MQFVAQHTSIPVPTVHCAFTRKGQTYIVMERIDGDTVANVWRFCSEKSKEAILGQAKKMIEELRTIHPPKGAGVANVDGSAIYDCRLPHRLRHGPFQNIPDFHRYCGMG
ncbi:uncharacterized protein BDZ99DRAFT_464738 [Mytilinidion resinicola]|uniref:Aminoglycoside phosphotransferase domain-containing protein n=1 Tax=Mytilinidion resinicola TaxID=574789 RepID=A0A6A6YIS4_9PEZI|nr:uncharacterized protein BDZ99DRAFT_464738 [Mytilinidion resinicola]KAF2807827.1 hypothetical protein BDZ99DRAFT_464738 [Mytilinidion resinicola]